ncbi:beta-glucosidase family protein [Modestobacter roseus]|nr:glycoside hydrolase family 3 N-terminal domain-containing protein [Modestobacter roseus]
MTVSEKAQQLVGVLPHALAGAGGVSGDALRRHLADGIGHISGAALTSDSPVAIARVNNAVQRHLVEDTRLGIPAILHNEALNGVSAKGFTVFPTSIGLAATWNPVLVGEMAALIRRQLRAVGIRQALSPVLDVARDARWGRVHETYGEEVALVTAMGVSFVGNMQGEDLRDGVIATAKHFLGYAMTEAGQNLAATHFGPRELYDVYATPFEAAIRLTGMRSVMNSYSEIDGEPVATSAAVLDDLLRGRLGFQGTVVSDYRTVQYLVERQLVASSPEEAAGLALAAGLDVELPSAYGYGATLARAVEAGEIDEALLDRAVLRVLVHKFELGLFEAPYVAEDAVLLDGLGREGVDLSATLAEQSVTLLKNDGGVLPFDPAVRRVAVIGPHAESALVNFPNYTYPASQEMLRGLATGQAQMVGMEGVLGEMSEEKRKVAVARLEAMSKIDVEQIVRDDYGAVGLAEAVQAVLPDAQVSSVVGVGLIDPEPSDLDAALAAAADADVVVLALGGRSGAFAGRMTEGEGTDSADIDLPAGQVTLARAVAQLGKPTAAVLFMGRPYGIAAVDEVVPGIVTAYFPGSEGPVALARVLFGLSTPGGKLPFTMPRHSGQVPIYQAHKRGSGDRREPADMWKGYRDMPMTPLFPFGHGLTYTTFEYGDVSSEAAEVTPEGEAVLRVPVRNTGSRAGAEVVQFYASQPVRGMTRPVQQLVGFARVDLEPGQEAEVEVVLPVDQLGFTGVDGRFVVAPGEVTVHVGSSSVDLRTSSSFAITGDRPQLVGRRTYLPRVSVRRPG